MDDFDRQVDELASKLIDDFRFLLNYERVDPLVLTAAIAAALHRCMSIADFNRQERQS